MSLRSHAIAAMAGAFLASGGFALAAATSGGEDVDALHTRIAELEAEVAQLKGEPATTGAAAEKCAPEAADKLVIPTKSTVGDEPPWVAPK